MTASYGMWDAMHCWRWPPGTWGGGCPRWCGRCPACSHAPRRQGFEDFGRAVPKTNRRWLGLIAAQEIVNNMRSDPLPPQKLDEFLRREGGQPCAQFPEQLRFRFGPPAPDDMRTPLRWLRRRVYIFATTAAHARQWLCFFRRIVDEMLASDPSSDSVVITSL